MISLLIVFTTGVVDSSGMIFYYIDTPRKFNAGTLSIGHDVNQYMIIPPKAKNYTIYGICSTLCTDRLKVIALTVYCRPLISL